MLSVSCFYFHFCLRFPLVAIIEHLVAIIDHLVAFIEHSNLSTSPEIWKKQFSFHLLVQTLLTSPFFSSSFFVRKNYSKQRIQHSNRTRFEKSLSSSLKQVVLTNIHCIESRIISEFHPGRVPYLYNLWLRRYYHRKSISMRE